MNRNLFWKFVFVVLAVFWSLYEIYPPKGRDLVEYFATRAVQQDETFSNIVHQARSLQQAHPERTFANLRSAIGDTPITNYFPFFETKAELNPTTHILNRLQREAAGKIKLGLDLQGGTSFLVAMNTNDLVSIDVVTNDVGKVVTNVIETELEGALEQAIEVLRKRVDKFGVAEPVLQPAGDNQILIQLPGLSEADRQSAKETIQRAAFLEFRLVHEKSDELLKNNEIPPGYELLQRRYKDRDGAERIEAVIVKKRSEPGLNGSIIKFAGVQRGNLGEAEIHFKLNSEGAARFAEVTKANVGRRLAIVLDGILYSAPNIETPILTGSGRITGGFSSREAFELANILQNPLRAKLDIILSNDVDPTLGRDSIRSGVSAALYGVIAVSAFMFLYYLFAGVVANAALALNIVILMGVMCSIGTTLTLPGIAGIVLTIGMAVDANVLIFERIREELGAGKSMRGALAAGYNKAFGTILDSNLTTLIASIILIVMGTGPVKGFGVTLTIGVCVSMFTALVVTRLIFDWLLSKDLLKNLKMLRFIKDTRIDFLKIAVPAFVISWLLIVSGNAYGIYRGKDALGVEFIGGETITLAYNQDQQIGVDEIRQSVAGAAPGDALIGYQRDVASGTRTLMVTVRTAGAGGEGGSEVTSYSDKVIEQLRDDFPAAEFELRSVDQVGPTVGAQIRNTAIKASLIAMFFILAYVAFRYEFSFAIGAVVAIIHDVLMTSGWYFLAGHQLNATTVAAFLTIIGFSINDTIVIFDRVREDLKLGVRGTFREVMNKALNQTLSRTIITSGTVLLATLSLYIFGGGVINDFAFCFLVGILTGTYSSIYIACFIVLMWHKGHRPNIGAGPVAVEEDLAKAASARA